MPIDIENPGVDGPDLIAALKALVVPSGTSFPGSPSSGDKFYRIDRNIEYFYDGTRWLSTQLFTLILSPSDNLLPFTSGGAAHEHRSNNPWAGKYDIYVEEVALWYILFGGSGGDWTIAVNDQSGNLATFSNLTATSNTSLRANVNAVKSNSSVSYFYMIVTENAGTAGLYTIASLIYRLVG